MMVREDVFISYSARSDVDKAFVEELEHRLRAAGMSVWRDVDKLYGGANFVEEIIRGLQRSKSVVSILSERSHKRNYVVAELHAALMFDKSIPVVVPPFTKRRVPFQISGHIQILTTDNVSDIISAIRRVSERPNTDSVLREERTTEEATITTLASIRAWPDRLDISEYQAQLLDSRDRIASSDNQELFAGLKLYNNPAAVQQGLYSMRETLLASGTPALWEALGVLATPFNSVIAAAAFAKANRPPLDDTVNELVVRAQHQDEISTSVEQSAEHEDRTSEATVVEAVPLPSLHRQEDVSPGANRKLLATILILFVAMLSLWILFNPHPSSAPQ